MNIESNGSVENVEMIRNNYADLAIVQRNVLLQNLYDESHGINNIELLSPLFEEKFHFYTNIKNVGTFENFKQLIDTCKKKISLGFTSKTGYSFNLFNTIAKYSNIDKSKVEFVFGNYSDLGLKLVNKQISGLVSFSLPLDQFSNDERFQLIYFQEDIVNLLSNRIPNVFKTELSGGQGFSLGSWTFLIGSTDAVEMIENCPSFINALESGKSESQKFVNEISQSIRLFKADEFCRNQYLNKIPISESLSKHLNFNQKSWISLIVWCSLAIITVYFIYMLLRRSQVLPKYYFIIKWLRYRHIVFGGVLLLTLYFICTILIRYFESKFYHELGLKSQILNLSNSDFQLWLFIRNLTTNDKGISAFSYPSKLLISFTGYVIWIGGIIVGVFEILIRRLNKKRRQGLMKTKLKEHFVVIGWNDTTPEFLLNTNKAANEFNSTKQKYVCIVENPEQILDSHDEIKRLNELKMIDLIKGEARDSAILEKANLHNANCVILLAEDNSVKSDEITLLRALAISRYCREKLTQSNGIEKTKKLDHKTFEIDSYADSMYIIAEINNKKFKIDLLSANVNEVIIASVYAKNSITQSILNPGVSKILEEILEFNAYNEFYMIDLVDKKNHHLRYKTFDELLLPLRLQGILLIGIKVVYHDKKNTLIIDETEKTRLLKRDGLDREIIVNPVGDIETSRRTDEDDHLIVFATNRKQLEKGIRKVKFEK